MRIHSIRESVASIFCTPNQGEKEEYTFASKISYTVLRKKERTLFLSNYYQEEAEDFSNVIAITHLIVHLY